MFMDDNYWQCWMCGCNHADCGHHIFGRGRQEGCEKSVLNYAPLSNHYCHLPKHGFLQTDEGKTLMFNKTLEFLSDRDYILKPIDHEFLEKYGAEIYRLKIKI